MPEQKIRDKITEELMNEILKKNPAEIDKSNESKKELDTLKAKVDVLTSKVCADLDS